MQTAVTLLGDTGFEPITTACGRHVPSVIEENNICVIVFIGYRNNSQEKSCLGAIQGRFYDQPVQILAVLADRYILSAVEKRFSDSVKTPITKANSLLSHRTYTSK